MCHEVQRAVIIRKIGGCRNDVVYLFKPFSAPFGGVEWQYGSIGRGDIVLQLRGVLALLTYEVCVERTWSRRSSDKPLGIIVKTTSPKSPFDSSSIAVSSMSDGGEGCCREARSTVVLLHMLLGASRFPQRAADALHVVCHFTFIWLLSPQSPGLSTSTTWPCHCKEVSLSFAGLGYSQ